MKRFALLAGVVLIILVVLAHTGKKEGVESPPAEENPVPPPSEGGSTWENETEEILVKVFETSYRTAGPAVGEFENGQAASLVLFQYGFENSGGPLSFNHPMGLATDGQRLILADTRNNRVLIWNELPDSNTTPDLVLGQPDFHHNVPGDDLGEMNWPVDVATDGTHLAVADTMNNRVLVWLEFPTENGEPADLVIYGPPDQPICGPWGVYFLNDKFIIVGTWGNSGVYIWDHIPSTDEPPDLLLTGAGVMGTPRQVWSDGQRLVVVDHNIPVESGGSQPGMLFWLDFPVADEPPDFYMTGMLWGPAMDQQGRFMALNNYGLAIWNGFPSGPKDEPDLVIGSPMIAEWVKREEYRFDDGDGSTIVPVGNRLYISLYNANMVVGYRSLPVSPDDLPDFALGSPSIWINPMENKGFFEGPVPASDGDHLFVASGFSRRLCVWRNIPDESGAIPDVVYTFPNFEPTNVWVENGKLALGTNSSLVYIWTHLPLTGEFPDVVLDLENTFAPPESDSAEAGAGILPVWVCLAEGRLFVWEVGGMVLMWNEVPTEQKDPDLVISTDLPISWLCMDNNRLIVTTRNDEVRVYDLVEILSLQTLGTEKSGEQGISPIENALRLVLRKDLDGEEFRAPTGIHSRENKLFLVDLELSEVLIWNGFPTQNDQPPDVALGRKVEWAINSDAFFWPAIVWYDGNYLWVGETKFSNRLLRFSPL